VKLLRITLRRSPIGYRSDQRATAEALGLTKLHRSVVQRDCPSIRGMIFKISHLLEVEEIKAPAEARGKRVAQ